MIAAALLLLLTRQPPAPTETGPALGKEIKVGDETLFPSAGLDLYFRQKPQPGIYRRIAIAPQDRPPPSGAYPASAFAARQEGDVFLSLTVGADGKPSACRITKPSGIATFDEHSCRDALAGTIFYPGLDDQGRRFGGTAEGRFSYGLHIVVRPMLLEGTGLGTTLRRPEPLQPITLDTLGIPRDARFDWRIDAISAMLAIDAKGSVTACLLTRPTYRDALDKGACDRLRTQRFKPAIGWDHRPAAGVYAVEFPLPR